MGTACTPLGNRLTLPKKISTAWLLLNVVTALLAETTTTTSADAAMLATLSARLKAAHLRRLVNITSDPVTIRSRSRYSKDLRYCTGEGPAANQSACRASPRRDECGRIAA